MAFSKADLHTITEIFENHILIVPEFQRGYAWKEAQWKDLWDDVASIQRRNQSQHYGGTIMLSALREDAGEVELIDGQQRMTSISLMLASISGKGFPISFRNNEAIQTYYDHYALKQDNLAPSLGNFHSYYARNIEAARHYFDGRASELNEVQRKELATALKTRVKLFVLMIHPEFDVHVAFETINNRGRPLSTLEKLKNRLIFLASNVADRQAGKLAMDEVHRSWKSIYASLGRGHKLLDDDKFLRAHAIGWFRHERKSDWLEKQLFEEDFSTQSIIAPESIRLYVNSLEKAALLWRLINNPQELPPQVAERLSALEKAPSETTKPLLLWALMRLEKSNKISARSADNDPGWTKQFCELVRQAERFGVLVLLSNSKRATIGQTDMNRAAFSLSHSDSELWTGGMKLPDDDQKAVAVTASFIKSTIHNIHGQGDAEEYIDKRFKWPGYFSADQMKSIITQRIRNQQGFYGWQFSKLIIHAWEDFLRGDKGRPEKKPWEKFAWDDSIEHIYPQTPEKGWTISINGNAKLARNAITNSLGNLLLISRPINSSLSNRPFEEKKKLYKGGSYSELQVSSMSRWTVVEIAARGIAMLRHAQKAWDFEIVPEDAGSLTDWLPFLFGDEISMQIKDGKFSRKKIIDTSLRALVEQFSQRP